MRTEFEKPLVGPSCFWAAGTTVGIHRHRIGVNAAHPQMQVRRAIEARDSLRVGVSGNAGCEIAEIAAERSKRVDLHCNNATFAVEAHARGGFVIPCLGIR